MRAPTLDHGARFTLLLPLPLSLPLGFTIWVSPLLASFAHTPRKSGLPHISLISMHDVVVPKASSDTCGLTSCRRDYVLLLSIGFDLGVKCKVGLVCLSQRPTSRPALSFSLPDGALRRVVTVAGVSHVGLCIESVRLCCFPACRELR